MARFVTVRILFLAMSIVPMSAAGDEPSDKSPFREQLKLLTIPASKLPAGCTLITGTKTASIIGAAGVYGGSAQLTTVTLLSQGSTLLLAVLSGVVVNLRLLLYSAALGERFAGQPILFRWLAPHLMIDQTFLMAQGRAELTGRVFRRYWLWLGALVLVVWCSSVAAGELLAADGRRQARHAAVRR